MAKVIEISVCREGVIAQREIVFALCLGAFAFQW
jgi:hypothetical protein